MREIRHGSIGVRGVEKDIAKIKEIIEELGQQYQNRAGDVRFAGVEGGTVKITPSGFCWR